jgi:hypothetical protein
VELDLKKVAASAPKRSPTPEQPREARKDLSYPGSGIMSPIAVTPRDSVPPMSSLHDDMPSAHAPSPPAGQTHEASGSSLSEAKHPTWATPVTALADMPSSTAKHHEMTSTTPRPLSPSQLRGYPLDMGYPGLALNGRIPNGSYPPVPSYPPVSAIPYVYPPYVDPHYNPYSRPMQRHMHPMSDPSMVPNHRLSSVPSMPRGENPYPVISAPGPLPAYHYSLESS